MLYINISLNYEKTALKPDEKGDRGSPDPKGLEGILSFRR